MLKLIFFPLLLLSMFWYVPGLVLLFLLVRTIYLAITEKNREHINMYIKSLLMFFVPPLAVALIQIVLIYIDFLDVVPRNLEVFLIAALSNIILIAFYIRYMLFLQKQNEKPDQNIIRAYRLVAQYWIFAYLFLLAMYINGDIGGGSMF